MKPSIRDHETRRRVAVYRAQVQKGRQQFSQKGPTVAKVFLPTGWRECPGAAKILSALLLRRLKIWNGAGGSELVLVSRELHHN